MSFLVSLEMQKPQGYGKKKTHILFVVVVVVPAVGIVAALGNVQKKPGETGNSEADTFLK